MTAPAPRPGLIPRADLQARLEAALEAKLCLLDAPAGSGKTTLLAQWCATAGAGRVAWVSLDEGDNDPTRLWVYVVEALQTVEPGVGEGALAALRRPSADLYRAVLPGLLNELSEAGSPLFLVLDDYHLIANPASTGASATSWTTSRRGSMWRCPAVPTRRCPCPGCGSVGSWPSSGSPTCSSPARRPRPC